jgi:hypothetical protein
VTQTKGNIPVVGILRDNIATVKKIPETLTDASKERGIEVNAEKTKYMFLPRQQTAGQNQYITSANKSIQNVATTGTMKLRGD